MYILLNENGYVESYALVGNLVGGIEVPDPENIEHFESHYEAYGITEGKVTFNDVWETMLEKTKKVSEIRLLREQECFPVINRGLLWYETLTVKQKLELTKWYQAWLDATNTGVMPKKLAWL
nr:MAG TPA: Protein of unknown function (DUF2977) [Caudoviricetes sp.]